MGMENVSYRNQRQEKDGGGGRRREWARGRDRVYLQRARKEMAK